MAPPTVGLLDTSVLIGLEDELLEELPDEAAISVASLAELHFGVLIARDHASRRDRIRRLGAIEAQFDALPIDAAIARSYAGLAHAVRSAGRKPRRRVMDLWIAATAHVHNLTLYTRNPDDFDGLAKFVDVRTV